MKSKLKRKLADSEYKDVELNIMPFIDVFSILNTFLLFSAVFLAMGIIKVQVPFFTNKEAPPTAKRSLEIKVDIEKSVVTLITSYNLPPRDEKKYSYTNDEQGLDNLHRKLVELRQLEPQTDIVTVFCEDYVTYEQLTTVLDAIKLKKEGDPIIRSASDNIEDELFLYPKVVIGSVLL